MILKRLFFISIILISSFSYAQYEELKDSLNTILNKKLQDTISASALNTLSMITRNTDLDKGEELANQALELSQTLDYNAGITEGFTNLGIIFTMRGNHTKALEYFYKTVEVYHKNNYTKGLASGYNNIAIVQGLQGNEEKALEYYLKASKILEDRNENGYGQAMLYNNIGSIYLGWRDDSLALEFLNKSLTLFIQEDADEEIAMNYNNIGQVYENQNNLELALEYQLKALEIDKKKYGEGGLYTLEDLGSIYLKMGEIDLSIKYYEECVQSQKEKGQLLQVEQPYSGLADAYSKKGNYKKALEYFQLGSQLKDSLLNEDRNTKIAEMESKYQSGKKERENELLQKENEIKDLEIKHEKDKGQNQLIVLVGVIFFIIITSVLFYVRYKYYQKSLLEKEKRKQEQQRYKAIIEAEEKERQRIASELHDGLGQLLSTAKLNVSALEGTVDREGEKLVSNSMKLIDSACSELRTISHNMMPTALIRKGLVAATRELSNMINLSEKVKISFIETGSFEKIDKPTEIALYRIIQESVNNMIKHADATSIKISLERINQSLTLSVSDNGKGFDIDKIEQSKGMGWYNIQSRADLLNGELAIDSIMGEGTSILIKLEIT